jgi:hypothetical protein
MSVSLLKNSTLNMNVSSSGEKINQNIQANGGSQGESHDAIPLPFSMKPVNFISFLLSVPPVGLVLRAAHRAAYPADHRVSH